MATALDTRPGQAGTSKLSCGRGVNLHPRPASLTNYPQLRGPPIFDPSSAVVGTYPDNQISHNRDVDCEHAELYRGRLAVDFVNLYWE